VEFTVIIPLFIINDGNCHILKVLSLAEGENLLVSWDGDEVYACLGGVIFSADTDLSFANGCEFIIHLDLYFFTSL
jgi:hypothetical protein